MAGDHLAATAKKFEKGLDFRKLIWLNTINQLGGWESSSVKSNF